MGFVALSLKINFHSMHNNVKRELELISRIFPKQSTILSEGGTKTRAVESSVANSMFLNNMEVVQQREKKELRDTYQ